MKSEYTGGESSSSGGGDIFGQFTSTLLDLERIKDNYFDMIEDSIWWVANQIKSFMMSEVTKILNAIGIAAIAPFPMFGKVLTDAIMFIMKEIACIVDVSLVDAILNGIRDAIDTVVNTILDTIDAIKCIFDAVFDAVFSLVDIAK